MVNANELRINNFILFNPTKKIKRFCLVKRIEEKKVLVLDRGLDLVLSPDEMFPIILTPKILLQSGFESSGTCADSDWYYKLCGIRTNNNGVCCFELNLFSTQYKDWGINLEDQYFGYVKYLHELQNKYFAIASEELEVEMGNE